MSNFRYKAIDENGKRLTGRIDAANPQDLELRLKKMELEIISFSEERHSRPAFLKKRTSRKDLIDFTFHMEQLLKAGVPILETLSDLRDSLPHTSRLKEVTAGIIEEIEAGKNFSGALSCFPDTFNSIYVSTVSVGEQSGQLHQVLNELASMLKWQDELASQAKKIAMYPAIAGTVVFGVLIFMMTWLVPQVVELLVQFGTEIPIQTKALIWTSKMFVNYWYMLIITPIALIAFLIIGPKKSAAIRHALDALILKVWLIGPILLKLKIARFTNYFALMYSAGITVLETIELCKSVTRNKVLEDAIERARKQISEGESISDSFSNAGMFPPFVIRMLRVGENSGALDTALANVSDFYTREAKAAIDQIEPALGPALILVLALIIGWIMTAIFVPVWDVMSSMGAGA
jgi:type IV pilus assembly protein PilC